VLNGRGNPRPATRERVELAVAELGFVPDGAARALSTRLKRVVGLVLRRVHGTDDGRPFAGEQESLLFGDQVNRGIEIAAQHSEFDLLVCSLGITERASAARIATIAGKCDGLILHDRVLSSGEIAAIARSLPVVTLAGPPDAAAANIGSDGGAGMRELTRHLVEDHGYLRLAYLAGHPDSPDNLARCRAFTTQARRLGAEVLTGPDWQGDYSAGRGAELIRRQLARGAVPPRAIACANDQTALGVVHALTEHGLRVPEDVAVTGFDDLPFARHLRLTTVRQPIQQIGAQAFEVLHSMITADDSSPTAPPGDILLPATLVRRESCGCQAKLTVPRQWRATDERG